MPTNTQPQPARIKFNGPVTIGKDTLELLSSGMYNQPLSIYREYVQNAADSLDEAAANGLRLPTAIPPIDIRISPPEAGRCVTIRDHGIGIRRSSFANTLTAIGASKKRGTEARGFRGIGRLAGLGYCQTLTMRSKHADDSEVCCMHWDCKKLKELLRDAADLTVQQILELVVELSSSQAKNYPNHFFEIEMQHVVRNKTDSLMSEPAIRHYLAQVAPVPFHPSFSFGAEIQEFLAKHKAGSVYNLNLNGTAVMRPHRDSYAPKPKATSKFTEVEYIEIKGISGGTDAVGWLLHGEYLGASTGNGGQLKGRRSARGIKGGQDLPDPKGLGRPRETAQTVDRVWTRQQKRGSQGEASNRTCGASKTSTQIRSPWSIRRRGYSKRTRDGAEDKGHIRHYHLTTP